MLSEKSSSASFESKARKLLPFVEEKLAKQCVGLSSKRKEAEKSNLKRDNDGKLVVSKLNRVQPDLQKLISSRSYMIKSLVEKVYSKK